MCKRCTYFSNNKGNIDISENPEICKKKKKNILKFLGFMLKNTSAKFDCQASLKINTRPPSVCIYLYIQNYCVCMYIIRNFSQIHIHAS